MCHVVEFLRFHAKDDPKKLVRRGHPLAVSLTLVTTVFLFLMQMLYVAPQLIGGVAYKLYWILAVFIVHNILGNMWACYRATSSVASLPENRKVPAPEEEHLWHYCDACERMAPPRSWHCKLCECCILKRDHHCIFTATCIGHNNHRYFFWFTFYTTWGTILCFLSTLILRVKETDLSRSTVLQHIEPSKIWHNALFTLTTAALLGPFVMLSFQKQIVCLNAVYYQKDYSTYDLGLRKNLRIIMGQRGLWTCLSPWLKSPLPQDGTQWQLKKSK